LRDVAEIVRTSNAQLIADEVMTGFKRASSHLLACHNEAVQPDFAAMAKGLTGGYLPMASNIDDAAGF